MKENKHTASIQGKNLDAVMKCLEEAEKAASSDTKILSPKERRKILKMGNKTLAFVKSCYEFAKKNPELCPKYFDMDGFEEDYNDALGLNVAINMATQVRDTLVNTQMCAGSEAFQTALLFYTSIKTAAANHIPGARSIYEDLRKRYPNVGNRKKLQELTPVKAEEKAV
jgi:hypothetical protein